VPDAEESNKDLNRVRRSSRRHDEAKSPFAPLQRPRWEAWLLALIPLLICFLGGGRSVFAKGIAASSIGLLILVAPPSYRLPKILLASLAALLAAPLVSFLPMQWLGPIPEWRTVLVENWGVLLPESGTPQPWVTFEAWLLFACGVAWLAWCTSRGTTLDDRRIVIQLLVAGICVMAVLTLLNHAEMIRILWWKFPTNFGGTFGPFANRNHTSSIMALGSVLCAATAYDLHRNKRRLWMLFLPMLAPFFVVVMTNTSRAGAVLFFLGTLIWAFTAALRSNFVKKLIVVAALVLAGIAAILILRGSLTDKFGSVLTRESVSSTLGGRTRLYSDVVKMTAESPWAGIGLGCFSEVYPQEVSFHVPLYRFLHPESDWFWIMAEGGMLFLVACATCLVIIGSMTGPWPSSRSSDSSGRQDWRIRHAAGIAALIAAVHGIVDVPNHSMGYALTSTLLLALAVRPSRVQMAATGLDRLVFRIIGLCVLASGITWLAISMGTPVLPGKSSAKLLADKARQLSREDRDGDALKLVDRAIAMNPLNWTHYFLRARLHLGLKHTDQAALLDFGRARAIEPHYANMCIEEGDEWLAHNSPFVMQAWREYIRRDPKRGYESFGGRLWTIHTNPTLMSEARKIATTPALKLAYLGAEVRPAEFSEVLAELLRQQPTLEGLEPESRTQLFRLWQQRGDKDALKTSLLKNLKWQQDGWQILCEEFAREGEYEHAYRLAVQYEPSPVSQSLSAALDMNQLERNFLFNPTDPRVGLDLYFAQKSKLQWNAALGTLEKIAGLPNSPAYIKYEMASVHAQKQDFRKAWELMLQYLSVRKLPKEPAPVTEPKKKLAAPDPPPVRSYE
jgi:O-Antigen ligase